MSSWQVLPHLCSPHVPARRRGTRHPTPLRSPPTASRTIHHVFRSGESGSSSSVRRAIFAATIRNQTLMNLKTIALAAGVSLAAVSIATAAVEAGSPSAQVGASQPSRSEVALIEQGSALMVRATINGTTTFTFEIDTGAGIVVLPRRVAAKLVTTADFLGMRTYVFGDGRQRVQPTYRLRSVTVGGLTATDVTCAIGDEEDTFLLGRSFLRQFKSWSIDNRRRVLALET
jgi:clan AA aspartic protease (TIGR02281 family)